MAVYWKPKHQELCEQWLTATTKQQYHIYDKLHGVLSIMAEIICKRYYNVSFSEQQDIIEQSINEVFLQLHKFNPKRSKAYSFCGMIIKQKIYDLTVRQDNRVMTIHYELPEDFESLQIPNEIPEETLFDKEALLKRFKTLKIKVKQGMAQQQVDREKRGYPAIPKPKGESLLLVLNLCSEFINTYEDFSSINIADYLYNNSELSRGTLSLYLNELFGYGSIPMRFDFKGKGTKDASIVQDDKTPSETNVYAAIRKMNRKKLHGNQYLYM